MNHELPQLLAMALASGLSSGLNAYASVALLGLMQRLGMVSLPAPLDSLAHPWVIGAAVALYLVEFVADKIPYFDSVWDAIHTFIRIPVGALLAAGMFREFPSHLQWIMAMAGGFLALQAHGTKASLRLAANASPEPFTNWALSLSEDAMVGFLMWFAARYPYAALAVVGFLTVMSFLLIRTIFRALGNLWTRFSQRKSPPHDRARHPLFG